MGKKIEFSPEVEQEIIRLYIIENKSQGEISKLYNCCIMPICRIIKKYNIKKTQEQIKETRKQTNIGKFGVENSFQNKEIKEKIKQTNIERFGVEHPAQNKTIQEKMKQTCLNRLGVENPFQSEEIKEKIKKTNIEKYGVENPSQNEDIKLKKIETSKKCYGVEYTFQNKDVRKKIKRTNIKRFGVENPSQRHIPYDKLEILYNKDKLINWLNSIDYKERTSKYCSRQLNISTSAFNAYIKKYNIFNLINHAKSEWENEAKRWFELNYPDLYVLYNNRTVIKPYELDIYIPDYNLAIELNGSYWHSDKIIQENKNMCAEEYHNMKNKLCKEHNIKLYTIWEANLTENNTLGYCLKKIFNTLQ